MGVCIIFCFVFFGIIGSVCLKFLFGSIIFFSKGFWEVILFVYLIMFLSVLSIVLKVNL